MIPGANWLNDMECEFIVQVGKVPEDVFRNNKFHRLNEDHNWKQSCE